MEEAEETNDGDDPFWDRHDFPLIEGLEELFHGTCSHTHTCNPPGPSSALPHSHTCVHTHTLRFPQQQQEHHVPPSDTGDSETLLSSHSVDATQLFPQHDSPGTPASFLKKRPLGNREAVKKYREKKKAHIAFLEEQVQQLRVFNQQLQKKLHSQAAVEAEVFHLRTLLAEFRGRIDGELGLHSQKLQHRKDSDVMQSLPGGYVVNSFSVPCGVGDVPCLHSFQEEENEEDEMLSSELQRSVFSCAKANNSCERHRESRKRLSSKTTGSTTVTDCIQDG